jgi:hypothetical protein
MDKQDERRVREIAREEILRYMQERREKNIRLAPTKFLLGDNGGTKKSFALKV